MQQNFPKTRKENITDNVYGMPIHDSYRWLEDANNPESVAWIEEQNTLTSAAFQGPVFECMARELEEYFHVTSYFTPTVICGKYFYHERQPDEERSVYYVKNGIGGSPKKLIDLNGGADKKTSLDFVAVSRTGKYLAYGVSRGGDEMSTLRIKNVETGNDCQDVIPRCRNSSVKWLPDDSGFYYTRNPREGEVPKNEEQLHVKVYFHFLGTPVSSDRMIFGDGRQKDDMIRLSLSSEGRFLAIQVGHTFRSNDVYMYDRELKTLTPLVVGLDSNFSAVFLENKLLIKTNYQANNFKILVATYEDMLRPIKEWDEFLSEREHRIGSLHVSKDKIFVEYFKNVTSEVIEFSHGGKEIGPLPLSLFSSLGAMSAHLRSTEFFYSVTSFTFPNRIYRYDPDTQEYSKYRETECPISSDEYVVQQEWFRSKDETMVPMFVIHKKGIEKDGMNPTILYGYGGFGSSLTPSFNRVNTPWLEHGGILAIANIRGGGEFGDSWHRDGIKENKQNSFDDFISAAEHLIAMGYTSSKYLGLLGGSNGGVLVSAVAVQRPDLASAICAKVPLTDMVRFPLFGMAVRWVNEYGDPTKERDLQKILEWSPYHNVKEGVEYPAMLFTTGENDTRVNPLHSRKMVALLQSVNKKNPVYLFTDKDAGHGSGKPVHKIIEGSALILAFFAEKLGLKA